MRKPLKGLSSQSHQRQKGETKCDQSLLCDGVDDAQTVLRIDFRNKRPVRETHKEQSDKVTYIPRLFKLACVNACNRANCYIHHILPEYNWTLVAYQLILLK